MCHRIVVKSLFIYELTYIGITKVSDNKSDHQTHSRSSAVMPFDSPYIISYLSSIVTMSLSCTVSEIFLEIKRHHMTMTTPIQGTVCNPNAKPSSSEPVYKI